MDTFEQEKYIYPNGTIIADRFEILSFLASGGMADVYIAKQLTMDREVALKVLLPAFSCNQDVKMRFHREVEVVSKLQHPNTIQFFDRGETAEEPPRLFIAMELLRGEELGERIKRGVMSAQEVLPIVRQVAESLADAHAHGIIHRDLKPDNIYLTTYNGVKVLDFGIAKVLNGEETREEGSERGRRLTKAGTAPGTPEYMSPEQARGKDVDGRSDLYSLGCVMYEMLCGRPPFEESTYLATILMQVQAAPPALPATVPDFVSEYVIKKLLAKDPSQRPSSAQEFIRDVDELMKRLKPGKTAEEMQAEIEQLRNKLAQANLELMRSGDMSVLTDNEVTRIRPVPSRAPVGSTCVSVNTGDGSVNVENPVCRGGGVNAGGVWQGGQTGPVQVRQPMRVMPGSLDNSDLERVPVRGRGVKPSMPGASAGSEYEGERIPVRSRNGMSLAGMQAMSNGYESDVVSGRSRSMMSPVPSQAIPNGYDPDVPVRSRSVMPSMPGMQAISNGYEPDVPVRGRSSMPSMPVMQPMPNGYDEERVPGRSRGMMPSVPVQPMPNGYEEERVPVRSRGMMPSVPVQPMPNGYEKERISGRSRSSMPGMPGMPSKGGMEYGSGQDVRERVLPTMGYFESEEEAVPAPRHGQRSASTRERYGAAADQIEENGGVHGGRPRNVLTGTQMRKGGGRTLGVGGQTTATREYIFMMFSQLVTSKLGPEKLTEALELSKSVWNAAVIGKEATDVLYQSAGVQTNLRKLIEAMVNWKENYFRDEKWSIESVKSRVDSSGRMELTLETSE